MTAAEMFSMISAGSFFENVFDKEVDWNAELDARDTHEFDSAWNSCYEKLHELCPSESQTTRDIREYAFKQTFRITRNAELAGYVSDDWGLISTALENSIQIEFINNLWDSYLKGNFPT
ncbi:hypothetical protein RB298_12515 [Priestia sp. BR_2]